ncbi:DHA2 family multidrug resistance protein-like MFS transporter [Stackebrandtia albiflava]|uniref:DHA2 family multidrug resistance protein-like MFS transporter n=1 Tax=Stackebrandtia albiflava TaxID=406432 RepID=A0A562V1Z7_9ACTN|nr:MFS transporter [Stackebrandtia albiflava]TWJ11832.1 DHA2 family multidrug resistance protein-like MFS transporter [Stackebrandtia albiflava]
MTDVSSYGPRVYGAGRRWGTLAISCLAMLLLAVDMTVLHLAVPKLVSDMAPSSTQLLWILDMYGFALAGLLITMGNLGDRIGRKRLLLIGSACFAVASLLTAYATGPELLIAARALLGVAGATLMPSTLSIIRNVFTDPKERTTAIGLWSSIGAMGFALGPLVGGALLNEFWWGSVFLINVPVCAVIVVAGAFVLPESRDPHPGRLDLPSIVMSIVGIVAVVYAMKEVVDGAWRAEVLVPGVVGLAVLVLFCVRQTRLAKPLIDVSLFRRRAFSATVSATMIGMFAMMSMSWIFAQFFQLVLGWSPLVSGLAGLPAGIGAASGGILAAKLIQTAGRAAATATGLLLAAVGFGLYSQVGIDVAYWFLVVAMIVTGFGISLTFATANDTVMASVPRTRAGAASAISETATELGGALGIAVLGSVLSAAYRSNLALPEGLPAEAARHAEDGLGTALEVAAGLPGETAGRLTETAREAFMSALSATTLTGAAVLVVLGVVVLFTMRGIPKVLDEPEQDDPAALAPPKEVAPPSYR